MSASTTTSAPLTYSAVAHFPSGDDSRIEGCVALRVQHLQCGNLIVGGNEFAIKRDEDRGWAIKWDSNHGSVIGRELSASEVSRVRMIADQLLEDRGCRIANVSINFTTPIED